MKSDFESGLDGLAELLRAEKKIIVGGSFSDLKESSIRIEQQMKNLELDSGLVTQDLIDKFAHVQSLARRNARLYQAVRNGIASAETTIKEIEDACTKFQTYTQSGEITDVAATRSNVEKRS